MRFAGQGFEKFTIARTGQTDRHTQRQTWPNVSPHCTRRW